MRRLASLLLAGLALAACGSPGGHKTPVACLNGPGAFTAALKSAPGAVTLAGGTPISGCIVSDQGAGDIANVGVSLVKVGTDLNTEARANPRGPATVRLGFLVGAVSEAASKTAGLHMELVRRLGVAASYSPGGRGLPADFRAGYEKGYAAGKDHG